MFNNKKEAAVAQDMTFSSSHHSDLNAFRRSVLATQLFTRTLEHPKWHDLIAWAPTAWLVTLANPEPLATTTTDGADGLPDRRVTLAALFQSMLQDGMRDPLLLGIGQNHQVRLEAGNQRIRCFEQHDIEFAPVIGYVNTTAITNQANGKHTGLQMEMNEVLLLEKYHHYVSPSDILIHAPIMK